MATMVKVQCQNKTCPLQNREFEARKADRDRGWGRFCSKSCKASRQTLLTGRGTPSRSTGGSFGNFSNTDFENWDEGDSEYWDHKDF